jgi:hypothetical protein
VKEGNRGEKTEEGRVGEITRKRKRVRDCG